MWYSQSQRIGKQRCTPFGYTLHVIATQLGFYGLLILADVSGYFEYKTVNGAFPLPLWQLLIIPFTVGCIAQALFLFSWWLAEKKTLNMTKLHGWPAGRKMAGR